MFAESDVCGRVGRVVDLNIRADQVSSQCSLAQSVSAPNLRRGADILTFLTDDFTSRRQKQICCGLPRI